MLFRSAAIALLGWVYIFATSGWKFIVAGLATLAVGVGVFFVRAAVTRTWPFGDTTPSS